MSYKIVKEYELKIIGKMSSIKLGQITPKESGIGKIFKYLKEWDLPLYEKLLQEYKEVLLNLKK